MIVLWLAAGVVAKAGESPPEEKDPVRGGKFVHVSDFSALKNLVQPIEWQNKGEKQEESPVISTSQVEKPTVYKTTALDAAALRMMLRQLPKSESYKPQIIVVNSDPTDPDEAAIIQMIAELL